MCERERERERDEREKHLWNRNFLLPPSTVFENREAITGGLFGERVRSARVRVIWYGEHCHYIVALLSQ